MCFRTLSPMADIISSWLRLRRRGSLTYKVAFGVAGESELLVKSDEWKNPTDWSREYLLYYNSQRDLFALPLTPLTDDPKPMRLTETPWGEAWPKVSPDGHWIAYESNQAGGQGPASVNSGPSNIYAESFPKRGFKRPVSTKGGKKPRWSPNGRELYYVAPDSTLMAVATKPAGTSLEIGTPAALFQPRLASVTNPGYGVAPDGRFLINLATDEQTAAPITVILNWASGLKQK